MAVMGFSHGSPPAAAACKRKLNAAAMANRAPTLEPKFHLRMRFIFGITSNLHALDTLDLIIPVGISGYEQNFPDFPSGFYDGFFIHKNHQIHRLGDQALLRRIRCLGNQAFEPLSIRSGHRWRGLSPRRRDAPVFQALSSVCASAPRTSPTTIRVGFNRMQARRQSRHRHSTDGPEIEIVLDRALQLCRVFNRNHTVIGSQPRQRVENRVDQRSFNRSQLNRQ